MLLPQCSSNLKYGPCPPTWGSRISILVSSHPSRLRQYIAFQIRAIGRGPFYPRDQKEVATICLAILFGMIWNIWFFYGLTGGWWADRTKVISDFEDQMGIIETYIKVAKQSAYADNIRR